MFSLDALFCHVDDFCQVFEAQWQKKLLNHGVAFISTCLTRTQVTYFEKH